MLVLFPLVKQTDAELAFPMNKRAKRAVHALLGTLIVGAVPSFEPVRMVHLLHDVVRVSTRLSTAFEITLLAREWLSPPSVLLGVVVDALLQVVEHFRLRARLRLETRQVTWVCVILIHIL